MQPKLSTAGRVALGPRWSASLLILAATLAVVAVLGGATQGHTAPELKYDGGCGPNELRPNEYAVIACWFRIENAGTGVASNLSLFFDFAPDLASPLAGSIFAFDNTANGEPQPFDTIPLSPELPDLEAGESLELGARLIFRAPHEESYGFDAQLYRDGSQIDSKIIKWDAVADAAYPPTNLVLTSTLITDLAKQPASPPAALSEPGEPEVETAEYELAVRNQSDQTMTDVTVLYKYTGDVALVSSDPPAPAGTSDIPIAQWDVGDLAPGEQARISVVFAPISGCASLSTAMVATARAGDTLETYAARPQDFVAVGSSCNRSDVYGFGMAKGGTGPAERTSTGSPLQVALALAFVGTLAIVGAAGMNRARRR